MSINKPNAEGYEIMTKIVGKAIEKALKQVKGG